MSTSTRNSRLELLVRNAVCDQCRLSFMTTSEKDICVTGSGKYPHTRYAVVTKTPLSGRMRARMGDLLREVDLDPDDALWLSAIKCRVWDVDPNKTDLKACKSYLHDELEAAQPPFVLTMGNEALFSALGKSGITKYRSRIYSLGNAEVVPTLAPQAIDRNPGQRAGFMADLRLFASLVNDNRTQDVPVPEIHYVMDKAALQQCANAAERAAGMSFDIESRSESKSWLETHPSSVIVSLSFTFWFDDAPPEIYAIPLAHPESPFRRSWRAVLRLLAKFLRRVPKSVAQNGKYDCRWLLAHGVDITQTFDTMIAAHLLDENRPKGLKPLAHAELGVSDWSIPTSDLWTTPIREVLEYNALDTWYTYLLYLHFKPQLLEDRRLTRLFKYMLMPASNEFVPIEQRGIWCDTERLYSRWDQCKKTLDEIEDKLLSYVPDEIPYDVNWNASNFLRWFLFEHLELPVLDRGKTKDDGTPGAPSVKESVMMSLAEMPGPGGEVAKLLLSRVEWAKFDSAFFSAYDEIIDENDRIHTTFKVVGTVTGRLSSGKEDDGDKVKVTGKKQIRGVNLQQVPRKKFIRGLFGAAPGYSFIEADYSQVELRIAAFIADERNLKHLYQTGQDVHMAMAMRMTGKPASQVTKEERKKAKAVNFGFLYGMGWMKFIETAWANYGVRVSEHESQAFRKSFFDEFPGLPIWHNRQRTLAKKYKRVQSPMGRIRHLPDIDSPVKSIKAEAERQAINSPVQAMASDMNLLSMVRLQRKFREEGIDCHSIGTVHDAINFECRTELLPSVLPMIKDEMENLPLTRMFGVHLDVPVVADLKVGKYWGDAVELNEDQVYNFDHFMGSVLTS